MENFIKPKRLLFAKEMSVASELTGEKFNVTAIKPQVEKLIDIISKLIDETAIKSQVD